jgi:hypothetical protein
VSGVQLPLEVGGSLPLDPVELAAVPILDRRRLYDDLGLDLLQRQAAEAAVRLVVAKQYRRAA